MKSYHIRIGPLHVRVWADETFLRECSQFFGPHLASTCDSSAHMGLRWEGNRCLLIEEETQLPSEESIIQVATPAARLTATNLYLRRLLTSLNPSIILFHGTALTKTVDDDRRSIILMGASGSGKTTLTEQLVQAGSQVLAEDWLMVDYKTKTILPFPRAAGHRTEKLQGYHPWDQIDPEPFSCSTQRTDLVFLTNRPQKAENLPEGGFQLACTWWDDEWQQELENSGPGKITAIRRADYFLIEFSVVPSPEVRKAVVDFLEARGSLVLMEGTEDFSLARIDSSKPPLITELSASAVTAPLCQQLLMGRPTNQLIFRSLSLFSTGHFWQLTPGGTPQDTINVLKKTIDLI